MPTKINEPRHGASIKTGIVMSLVAVFVSLVVSLLYPPYCLSVVGETKDGIYQYAASIILFMTLLSFGVENSYVRFAARAEKEGPDAIRKLNTLYLMVFGTIGLAEIVGTLIVFSLFKTGVVVTGYDPVEHELMTNYVLILGLSQGVGFVLSLFSWHLFFKTHFIVYQSAHILTKILSASIGAIALAVGGDAIWVGIAALAANILSGLLCLVASFFHHEMRFERLSWNEAKPILKEILSFSIFVFLSMVVSELNAGFGRWAVGAFGEVEDCTLIGYGIEFYVYESLFVLAVSRVFIPSINEAIASGDEAKAKELYKKCAFASAILVFLIAGGFTAAGRQFVYTWLDHTPLDSWAKDTVYYLGCGYLWCFALPLTSNAAMEIARAENKHHLIAVVDLGICLVGALLSAILVIYLPDDLKVYGPLMGLGSASFIAFGVVNNIIYGVHLKLPLGQHLVKCVLLVAYAVIAIAVVYVINTYAIPKNAVPYVGMFFINAAIFVVIYGGITFASYHRSIRSLLSFKKDKGV